MKYLYLLTAATLFFSGCDLFQTQEREVFTLGDDFYEISAHAEKKKETPDMDMLLRVKLPPNPTRGELINYINMIYTLSRNQRSHLSSDPQVGMLTKVGRENLELLLQLSPPGVPWMRYGMEAARALATEEEKALILSHLKNNPPLAKVVYAKGWCEEADPILSELVSTSSAYLTPEAVKCLASLNNSAHHRMLIDYMINGNNSHNTYKTIKQMPNIDLSEALPLTWENSRADKYQAAYLIKDTLASGYTPAFHFLFETLDDNNRLPVTIYDAAALIRQYAALTGSKAELRQWYEKHRKSIVFDDKAGKYVPR